MPLLVCFALCWNLGVVGAAGQGVPNVRSCWLIPSNLLAQFPNFMAHVILVSRGLMWRLRWQGQVDPAFCFCVKRFYCYCKRFMQG
ncbi:hypothetical protein COLO4_34195 [Corchorus olitorius]|uniref:Secreted protein n=1 Tax=Corchorus olitorius TaxID=93759 RepID=A0A1R3GN30_9ROSI|nr:hypothetical protein COLO4_34195 [Corchorus olitorius]